MIATMLNYHTASDVTIDWNLLCDAGPTIAPAVPSFVVGRRTVALLGTRIGRSSHWERPVIQPHSHSTFEAMMLLQGEAVYLGQTRQTLASGSLWVHPPGVVHAWQEAGEPCLTFSLRFTVQPLSPVMLPAQWACCPEAVWLAVMMARAIRDGQSGWTEQVRGCLTALFVRVWQALGWEMETASVDAAPSLLSRLDQFMTARLDAPLHANEMADYLDISLRSLQRYVKQATGDSLMHRLQCLRLEKAAQLLEETEWPFTDIRKAVGIPDAVQFSRLFRRHFGQTPSSYRRRWKGGENE